MKLLSSHGSAGKLLVDIERLVVDDVTDPALDRDHVRAFVHAARDAGVAVAVPDARANVLARRVDDLRSDRRLQIPPNLNDLAVLNQQI